MKTLLSFINNPSFIIGFTLLSCLYFSVFFSVFGYISAQFGKDFFDENYIAPSKIDISFNENNSKNLVLIYVESLETTYSNTKLYNKDLLHSLNQLNGTSFLEFREVPTTGWTMASIVASQCSVPLKELSKIDHTRSEGNRLNDQGERVKNFLPGATCLGDILKDNGYHNVFMGGAYTAFAGKEKFLKSHGYDEIYGREEWLRMGAKRRDIHTWGLFDGVLFLKAKHKLKQLHDYGDRFNLTILTLDTHEGAISKVCKQKGRDMVDSIECASDQLYDFVMFAKDNGYLNDTNIVIMGDHLNFGNYASKKNNTISDRYIFNKFISNYPIIKNREEILHFDMLPTILEFIGFDINGGRLGLGYSAIKENNNITPNKNRYKDFVDNIRNRSVRYMDLWKKKESE